MCSISGFKSNKPLPQDIAQRLASALLYYGAERGNQSAGAYVDGKLYKKAIEPSKLIESNEFKALFTSPVSIALLHTRYPTCGERGDNQAQPFTQGDTVTIHNGWYTNTKELKDTWNIQKTSGVDSELITSFIDSYGIRALPSFLETTSGVSAIASIYQGKLYLTRLGNPLAYCHLQLSGGIKVIVFASTQYILESALKFCFLLPETVKFFDLKEGKIYQALPDRIEGASERFKALDDTYTSKRRKRSGIVNDESALFDSLTDIERDEWREYMGQFQDELESEDRHVYSIARGEWEK